MRNSNIDLSSEINPPKSPKRQENGKIQRQKLEKPKQSNSDLAAKIEEGNRTGYQNQDILMGDSSKLHSMLNTMNKVDERTDDLTGDLKKIKESFGKMAKSHEKALYLLLVLVLASSPFLLYKNKKDIKNSEIKKSIDMQQIIQQDYADLREEEKRDKEADHYERIIGILLLILTFYSMFYVYNTPPNVLRKKKRRKKKK